MVKIPGIITTVATAIMMTLSSCTNPVFEYEGDCEVIYYLNFIYENNLKWADAFPSEVNSVNVYAFDENGLFVREFSEVGAPLSVPGYSMRLDLNPGNYTLVGWCGLVNDIVTEESFSVTTPIAGETTLDELTCNLNTLFNSERGEYSDSRIHFLFHGNINVELPDTQDGQHYFYTMPLTKDTNHIRITLQQIGEDLTDKDFDLSIIAPNGKMAYNNDIIGNTPINYLAWNIESDIIGIDGDDEGTRSTDYLGVIADLSTCRMMASQQKDCFLSVTHFDGESSSEIFRVPFIQFALSAKQYYEKGYGRTMTDQEFLDRQDEYSMTFFLDEDMKWMYAEIKVLSWRVVIHNYEI